MCTMYACTHTRTHTVKREKKWCAKRYGKMSFQEDESTGGFRDWVSPENESNKKGTAGSELRDEKN